MGGRSAVRRTVKSDYVNGRQGQGFPEQGGGRLLPLTVEFAFHGECCATNQHNDYVTIQFVRLEQLSCEVLVNIYTNGK